MKEKILALLLATFAGVRKDGLNHLAGSLALTAKTEEEANEVVGKLTADQVKQFVTDWRKDADAEITKANQTYEDGLKKKYDLVEKKPEGGEGGSPTPAPGAGGTLDAKAVQAMITEAVKAATEGLQTEVATLKGSATTANRRAMLEKELADVPESYKAKVLKDFDRMAFKDDDGFNEYLNDTKTDVATFGQELADKGLAGQGQPLFGKPDKDGVSAGVASYIKETTDPSKGLGGKEV
jgi:hypothetical protein